MEARHCECCGKYELEMPEFEICPICKWEDDPLQGEEPDYSGGANEMSLNQARQAYKDGKRVT